MIANQLNELFIVVNDQCLALAALEGVGRNAVLFHELIQNVARDAAELGPGDAESFQLAGIEAANDRLLADFADSGRFARGIDRFHVAHKTSFLSRRLRTEADVLTTASLHTRRSLPWHDNRPFVENAGKQARSNS